jgi:hypothetical protein
MFNSPYPNFVNARSEGNCKCSVLIRRTQFALYALYNTDFIIIINLRVDIDVVLCTG